MKFCTWTSMERKAANHARNCILRSPEMRPTDRGSCQCFLRNDVRLVWEYGFTPVYMYKWIYFCIVLSTHPLNICQKRQHLRLYIYMNWTIVIVHKHVQRLVYIACTRPKRYYWNHEYRWKHRMSDGASKSQDKGIQAFHGDHVSVADAALLARPCADSS